MPAERHAITADTFTAISEPSGLAALAIVMVTLALGLVMRLAEDVRVVVWRCVRIGIDLAHSRRPTGERPHPSR
jgi:hypothetical protein